MVWISFVAWSGDYRAGMRLLQTSYFGCPPGRCTGHYLSTFFVDQSSRFAYKYFYVSRQNRCIGSNRNEDTGSEREARISRLEHPVHATISFFVFRYYAPYLDGRLERLNVAMRPWL